MLIKQLIYATQTKSKKFKAVAKDYWVQLLKEWIFFTQSSKKGFTWTVGILHNQGWLNLLWSVFEVKSIHGKLIYCNSLPDNFFQKGASLGDLNLLL